jgi:hypothetical protein
MAGRKRKQGLASVRFGMNFLRQEGHFSIASLVSSFRLAPAFDQCAVGVAEGVSVIGRKPAGPKGDFGKRLSRTHLIRRPLAAEHFNVAKQVVRFALRLAVMPLPCNPLIASVENPKFRALE